MTDSKLSIGGAVCFWRLAKSTNRGEVKAGLEGLGVGEYVPEPRSPLACLRAVLPEVYPAPKGCKHTVRPIKNGKTKGFAVVKEKPDDTHAGEAWGEVVATAKIDEKENELGLELDPWNHDNRYRVLEGMEGAAGWLTNASVGTALVNLVEKHCDGVALRPSGGVYWIREDRLDEWTRIADVFESASAKGDSDGKEATPNAIYVLRVMADEQMVRAVGDALTSEVSYEVASIEADVAGGNLGGEACITRLRKTATLEAKVKRYERAFASPLTELQEAVRRAGVAVAQATLQASASAFA